MLPRPPGGITDAPLFVVPRMLDALRAWHAGTRLDSLPAGSPEHARLAAELERLGARLLDGIQAHPTRFWVMTRIRDSLDTVRSASSHERAAFGPEVERLMHILGIDDVDGLVACFLTAD